MAAPRPIAQELDRQKAWRWPGHPAPARPGGPCALRWLALSPSRAGQLPADAPVQYPDIAPAARPGPRDRDPRPEFVVSRRSLAIAYPHAAPRRHAARLARIHRGGGA